ncbi:SDR family NAD(P)-dependent oxidoreductase [Rhodopila sp.]|uniref:SDR family NAD(P)-dependent oxidoreductase n=1 Tax=Rhodopila sp. TaxID=2480087 RepID=UPI003D13040E
MDFHNKVALITGAGNGIGRATASGFASRGARVIIVDRDQAAGEATAGILRQQGGDACFISADVTQSADVQNYVRLVLEKYGAIDCFHNNAGIEGSVAPTHQYDEVMFDRVMAVNVKGVFLGLRHVLPVMLKQGRGAVVNTASVAGLVASPGMPAYVASKHAVIGLTKTAAGEVARSGVRVNCICPGPIETRMIHSLESMISADDPASVGTRYQSNIPIGRYGTADEVANLVIFLCSDLASNITGAQYVVDGGRTATGGAVTNNLVR